MLLGSHLSIAGNMSNALRTAEDLGLDCVQVFTKNQQQWKVPPLKDEVITEWRSEVDRLGWRTNGTKGRLVSHASYLINLGSPNDELWEKSIGLMIEEVTRCDTLGIPFLVHHPGAYTTSTEDEGLDRIAMAYERLLVETDGMKVVLCLENTVGSGSNLGGPFEQLADLRKRILKRNRKPSRVGYCFDTCHAHAFGYDVAANDTAKATMDEFDRRCGLKNLRVVHLNDSKKACGSRADRHEHIGKGTIGSPGFREVVNRPELADAPMIMETPKGEDDDGTAFDTLNARRLRRLVARQPAGAAS